LAAALTAFSSRLSARRPLRWRRPATGGIISSQLGASPARWASGRAAISTDIPAKRDWIVVSAITSKHAPGFVETVATPGGKRGPGTEERRFLVASDEYQMGRFGFVIDEARHEVYGGPSDFVGWR
jgi:hypothetical protein